MRLGLTELIFIFGIILIVFGPTKLPTLGKSMGEAIKNFKDGLNKVEVKDENTNETNNDGAMPITSHLLELRKRLVIIFLTVLVFSFISFLFSEDLIKNLMSLSKGYKFIYNTPEALIIQSLKLAIMSGIVLSSPVIFFNIWMFVSPALKFTERVVITIIFTLGVGFIFNGLYLCILHNNSLCA